MADSPFQFRPIRVTLWVCDTCGYWRSDRATGIHVSTNPEDPMGKMLRHELREAIFEEAE